MPSPGALMLVTMMSVVLTLMEADPRQATADPALRAAVEKFFSMQAAEDVAGYLALWSTTAKRPTAEQLKYVFESGDDTYSEISIIRIFPSGDRVRVRVNAVRDRVMPSRTPGGTP